LACEQICNFGAQKSNGKYRYLMSSYSVVSPACTLPMHP
jgi:hypothetical protein